MNQTPTSRGARPWPAVAAWLAAGARKARPCLAAWELLTAPRGRLAQTPAGDLQGAWAGLIVVSLAWGLLSMGIWSACQGAFGYFSAMPALVTAALFVLWGYRRAMGALAAVIAPRDAQGRVLALGLLAVAAVGMMASLRVNDFTNESIYLPAWLRWIRPFDKHFRVLLLAPLWGAWAMIVLPKFCRVTPATDAATAAFAGCCGPLVASLTVAIPLAWSLFYFHFLQWWDLFIPAVTIASAIAGGMGLCRFCGGLQRRTLLTANLLTQAAFVLAYLIARNLAS